MSDNRINAGVLYLLDRIRECDHARAMLLQQVESMAAEHAAYRARVEKLLTDKQKAELEKPAQ